jgi:hypothetical protein
MYFIQTHDFCSKTHSFAYIAMTFNPEEFAAVYNTSLIVGVQIIKHKFTYLQPADDYYIPIVSGSCNFANTTPGGVWQFVVRFDHNLQQINSV